MPKTSSKKAGKRKTPGAGALAASATAPTPDQVERVCEMLVDGVHPSCIVTTIAEDFPQVDCDALLTAALDAFTRSSDRPRAEVYAWAIACARGVYSRAMKISDLTEARLTLAMITNLADRAAAIDDDKPLRKDARPKNHTSEGVLPDDAIDALTGH